ncbi:MAG TPA: cupredoxin domain-containing protein [Candidatus Eisenbacteria bacterium]|nr:cupredoxin domain-containing protein [Candidatus Eisenbacteria bacterium]
MKVVHRRYSAFPIAAAGLLLIAVAAVGCGGGSAVKDRVVVEVTQEGFVPKEIPAKVGQPITLVVTRKTDLTCAKQIVFADLGVEKELPMNQAVEVTVTPERQGELRFACDMDMIAGKLVVEP